MPSFAMPRGGRRILANSLTVENFEAAYGAVRGLALARRPHYRADRRPRHCARAGRAPVVSAAHGRGEPALRRVSPEGAREAQIEPCFLLRVFPAAGRAPASACGLNERRRAADAGARARADA